MSNFIVQCGESREDVEIEPIKNEFHSRLRFTRRGLVAMASNEGSECSMEFFFTLDATPELQNKHTIFAKVSGETIYNVLKLNDSQTDANDRPLSPHTIKKVKILHNPFDDLVPSEAATKGSKEDAKDRKTPRQDGVKNFKLISFGDEAEEDEQEVGTFSKEKEKSSKVSEPSSSSKTKVKVETSKVNHIEPAASSSAGKKETQPAQDDGSDSDYETTVEKEKLSELERKRKEIQDQINEVKKQYQKDKKEKTKVKEVEPVKPEERHEDEAIQDYLDEKEKYKKKKSNVKGSSREAITLSLLAKFKDKLHKALETEAKPIEENSDDENWLSHKLDFSESTAAVLAKDASKKEDDWYDIFDPRNPLNKRKRAAEKTSAVGETNKKSK